MRIYVGHYDLFWSLTVEEWVEVCKQGMTGEGYELSKYKELKNKPPFIHRNENSAGHWCSRHDVRYVEPLDWISENFEEEIEELKRLGIYES